MGPLRYVYAVTIATPSVQSAIDLMRVVAKPDTRRRAHLTLRGPYAEPLPAAVQTEVAATVADAPISVGGAGSFFGPSQSTIFVRCDGDVLRSVWDKPGLGYTPHLTVYDGEDREFASRLLSALEAHPFLLDARLGELEEMEVGAPRPGVPLLELGADRWSSELFGSRIENSELIDLDSDERVALIARIAERLRAG